MEKRNVYTRIFLILFVLLVLSGVLFYFISIPRNARGAVAEKGVLDLADADLGHALFRLDGEWEFYFEEFLSPQEFSNRALEERMLDQDIRYIPLPNGWHAQGYPIEGFATYRLRILTDEPELTIFVPEIMTASRMYINGELGFEAGIVGTSKEEYKMGLRNAFVNVEAQEGEVEIVIWASNFYWSQGGLTKPIEIGLSYNVLQDVLSRRMLLAAFIGGVLMIGIYHFILFLHQKKDKVYLIFALLCLTVAARFFLEINALGDLFLPGGLGLVLHRVYMSLIVIQAGFVLTFTHRVLGMTYGGRVGHKLRVWPIALAIALVVLAVVIVLEDRLSIGYSVLCLAGAVMLCSLSYNGRAGRIFYWAPIFMALIHAMFVPYTFIKGQWIGIAVLPLAMTVVFAIRDRAIQRNPYNLLYLVSMIVFIIWEPLTKIILLDHYFVASVASNLFFMISQCILLAVSYAVTKRHAQEMADEAELFRRMSHGLRTPLTKISTNIQIANRQEETDHMRLEKSQDEIMHMADMIDQALEDEDEEE